MALRVTRVSLLIAAASCLGVGASAETGSCAGGAREILRLRVVNDVGGEVSASRDLGQNWQVIGRVVRYTTQANRNGYTASKWIPAGQVAATAVNAVHISAGWNEQDDRGIVFSILPREFVTPPKAYGSFLSPDSSIYTDLPAGEGLFGGGAAPFVGSPVYLQTASGDLTPLPEGYLPARGDQIVIVVLRPERYPIGVEFENTEGGTVSLRYADGSQRVLGYVIRPVRGVGRFEGSLYTGVGRIRANHAGVVDISTSPKGLRGGFQIIPVGHALDPEMRIAWERTQWMIVGPVEEQLPLWEGLMPLFYQHIRPDYLPGDLYSSDWERRLLARFLADVDAGSGWAPMPVCRLSPDAAAPLPEWADRALAEVKRIRILFPLEGRLGQIGAETATGD